MKKRYVLLYFIFILILVGCNDDTLKENKINNYQMDVEEVSGEQNYENEILPEEESAIDDKIDVDGQKLDSKEIINLKALFSKKWIESYESPKLIPVNTFEDKNLFETIWYVDKELEGSALMFFNDGRYLLAVNRFGDDVIGDYKIIDDYTIKLIPKLLWGAEEGDYLYPEYYESMTLTLKRDSKNIYYTDMLILEGTGDVFYSLFSATEEGAECLIDGYEVNKTDETDAVIMVRTNLKEKLDINSKDIDAAFTYEVNYFVDNPYKLEGYYTKEELKLFEDLDGLLKGMTVTTLARTKDKYSVSGKEDFWYYVSYYYFGGVSYEGWVYGAYLESFDQTKVDIYLKMLMEEVDRCLATGS
jgi:hypothetical protein